MDLNALRQFLAVAKSEHLSRAAAELRVAQPSLSRTIARLEAELGAPLFDRAGRLQLNDTGSIFQDYVERALGELEAGRRAVSEAVSDGAGSVRLAAETFLPLTGPLATFKEAHPEIELQLHQMAPTEMVRALQAKETDLCLASQPISATRTTAVVIHRERVWLATTPGHRLADAASIRIEDLADEPFVTTKPGQWQRRLLDRLFADHNLEPHIVCESDEPATTYTLVSAGLGVGLFPTGARETPPHPPVAWVAVDSPHCTRTLSLHWRDDDRLSTAAQLMRSQITEWNWGADQVSSRARRPPI